MRARRESNRILERSLGDWRFLTALAALIVNDHWAKAARPGLVTGKLSDIAGTIVLAVVLGATGSVLARSDGPRRDRIVIRTSLVITGGLLVAIKTSEAAARFVEEALRLVTGLDQQIVVDPTDLVGLAGLVVASRVLREPHCLDLGRLGPPVRRVAFALALLACTATSYQSDAGWTTLETRGDGTVVAMAPEDNEASRDDIVSSDGGRTWTERASDNATTEAADERAVTGLVCLTRQPNRCVRTSSNDHESRIEESSDGGRTWTTTMASEPESLWVTEQLGHGAEFSFHDVELLADDTVLVAAAHVEPIRRDPESGRWSPTMAEIRELPVEFILVALVFAFPMFGAVRRIRALSATAVPWFVIGALSGMAAQVAAIDTVGPGVAIGSAAAFIGLTALALHALSQLSKASRFSPKVALAAAGLAGVVAAPFTLFAQDMLSWNLATTSTMAAVVVGPIVAGLIGPPPTRRTRSMPPPPPPPPAPPPPPPLLPSA